MHPHPLAPQAERQWREVAVGRHQAHAIELPRVHQVHRVQAQRDVGRVLARGVGEEMHRLDGVVVQHGLEAPHAGPRPIGKRALDDERALTGGAQQDGTDQRVGNVLRVDQHGELLLLGRHAASPLFFLPVRCVEQPPPRQAECAQSGGGPNGLRTGNRRETGRPCGLPSEPPKN